MAVPAAMLELPATSASQRSTHHSHLPLSVCLTASGVGERHERQERKSIWESVGAITRCAQYTS
jgi:hypothetical protein